MSEVRIKARKNGPYLVEGPVTLVDYDGNVFEVTERVALCRCGGSSNKPFCDSTHKTNGFTADESAPRRP